MNAATIRVGKVSKWFGSVVAVNDVSFEIGAGVAGLLGPNGAGKTTLLRMIAGLLNPSEGTISVLDRQVRNDPETLAQIGVLPEHDGVYGFLTGREFVELNARLSRTADVKTAVDRVVDAVQLADSQPRPLAA
jgi:ABC-2 type transport system ATP-binding protein